ncbi:MAG: cytochrome c oxidase assembly protein [Kordiimonadaceae bacterium]|nr:cytochrome c oxidase assembly protein [Kordiimonadaceae bacterium]
MTESAAETISNKNRQLGGLMLLVAVGMVGLAFAAVPLYKLFCQVTGYGGTTKQVELASNNVIDRDVKVRFVANTHRDMPWEFKPIQVAQTLKIGAQNIAYYEAYNPTNHPVVGRATYNVTPHKAGEYFSKIDCFCFTEQILEPGERAVMPVVYFVDPDIDQDRNLDEVTEMTLSYTFFILDEEETAEVLSGR